VASATVKITRKLPEWKPLRETLVEVVTNRDVVVVEAGSAAKQDNEESGEENVPRNNEAKETTKHVKHRIVCRTGRIRYSDKLVPAESTTMTSDVTEKHNADDNVPDRW
jgi:hypothetical protein